MNACVMLRCDFQQTLEQAEIVFERGHFYRKVTIKLGCRDCLQCLRIAGRDSFRCVIRSVPWAYGATPTLHVELTANANRVFDFRASYVSWGDMLKDPGCEFTDRSPNLAVARRLRTLPKYRFGGVKSKSSHPAIRKRVAYECYVAVDLSCPSVNPLLIASEKLESFQAFLTGMADRFMRQKHSRRIRCPLLVITHFEHPKTICI